MSSADRPFFAGIDQVLLGSHVLLALESGRLPMHAGDYRKIAADVAELFVQMDIATLHRIRAQGPFSLRSIAENVVVDRHVAAVRSADTARQMHAERMWFSLLARLLADRHFESRIRCSTGRYRVEPRDT